MCVCVSVYPTCLCTWKEHKLWLWTVLYSTRVHDYLIFSQSTLICRHILLCKRKSSRSERIYDKLQFNEVKCSANNNNNWIELNRKYKKTRAHHFQVQTKLYFLAVSSCPFWYLLPFRFRLLRCHCISLSSLTQQINSFLLLAMRRNMMAERRNVGKWNRFVKRAVICNTQLCVCVCRKESWTLC